MKKLALTLAGTLAALVMASAGPAEAAPADAQSDCVVAAMITGDFRAAVACDDAGGATANSRSRNIDWD